VATVDDVRSLGSSLERSYEVHVRGPAEVPCAADCLRVAVPLGGVRPRRPRPGEAREFVVDAWRMVVPKKLARADDLAHPEGPG
jgi:hypothetical protein